MKRFSLIVLFFISLPVSMQGQSLWSKFLIWVKEGSSFDSTYIYQCPRGFQVSIDASAQLFSSNLKSDLTATLPSTDEEGNEINEEVPVVSTTSFSDNVNGGLGVGFAYGKLGLGFGVVSWPRAYKKSSINFHLGYQGNKWGINATINGFQHYANSSMTVGTEGSNLYSRNEWQSKNPCTVIRMGADAYWIINRRRFSYTSAYKCDMVQRRSNGSALICAALVLNGVACEEGDTLLTNPGYKGYSCFINSVGAGYSHNFVLKHHDATGPKNEGLFNITLNLTIMPMLTYSSHIYVQPMEGDNIDIASMVTPNAFGLAAMGFYVGQWYFSVQYRHNFYYFHSDVDMDASDMGMDDPTINKVNVSGMMQDWKFMTMAVFNF